MVKRIKKTTKNHPTRERKKIIIVGTEGDNKTEYQYLRSLEKTQNAYHFIFAPGNETDPVKIVRNTVKKAEKEEISTKHGDLAISIFDLDLDHSKKEQLRQAKILSGKHNIELITSNPSFEVWYLEHFGYTSKPFSSNAELITELEKYIPGYQKNTCNFDVLYPLTDEAVENCERLDAHHKANGFEDMFEFSNPHTDVYRIAKLLTEKKNAK